MVQNSESRRIAKNTAFLYLRMVLMMGIALYTSRVVLRALGVEDFGIYNVVGGVVSMLSFINISMAASTQRFITFELERDDATKLRESFNTSLLIHIAIATLVLIFGESIGLWFLLNKMVIPAQSMSSAIWVYHLSILSAMVMILSVPYNAVIIAHEKMGAFAYISIFEGVMKLVIALALTCTEGNRLKIYATLMFLTQLIVRICYGWYCKRFGETRFKPTWNRAQLREMSHFALWTMNGNLAVAGYTQGLNILLNIFFNPIVNAARAIAVQVQTTTLNFCRNFQMAVNPQITKSYSRGDYSYMHKLIYTSSTYSLYLLLFVSLPILLNTEYILQIWLGEVPQYTVSFVRLSILIGLLDPLTTPMITAVHATGFLRRFQLWEGGILLSIVPISCLFLRCGMPPQIVFIVHLGVAIVAQIVRIMIVCPMIRMAKRKYVRAVALPSLWVCIISSIAPIIVWLYLPYGVINFILTSLCCVVSVAISVYLYLPPCDKIFIMDQLRKRVYWRYKYSK